MPNWFRNPLRHPAVYVAIVLVVVAAVLLGIYNGRHAVVQITETTLASGRFGSLHVYRGDTPPQQLVLFVSGEDGWQDDVATMARALVKPGVMVMGIDINQYRKGVSTSTDYCDYPAGELEALSRTLQQQYGLPKYRPPILVGYAGGATLVYVALAQSPKNTFTGAISLAFQPTLKLTKSLCKGLGSLTWNWRKDDKGMGFDPATSLPAPWLVLHADHDHARSEVAAFVNKIPGAKLVVLPNVGDTPLHATDWIPQLQASFTRLTNSVESVPTGAATATALDNLPLIEVPAVKGSKQNDLMAVVVSGDGGWANIDRDVAGELATQGIPTVGWDSLHYFWSRRTPDSIGQDLSRVLNYYLKAWDKHRVLLIGYSLGADVLPFMASRLPADVKGKVVLVALLGISQSVDFEFRLTDWLPGSQVAAPHLTGPEVAKLMPLRVLCVYGAEEDDSLCPQADSAAISVRKLPGGHHFNGDYQTLTRIILETAR
ncbi:MAG: virulence factor family protein [Gammaproteobacteria bacterium]|nr:virulence factor family protein [Gammaproteobacteria bacterium]